MSRKSIGKRLLTAVLAGALTLALGIASLAAEATQGTWEQSGPGWRFKTAEGSYAVSQWVVGQDGKSYYIGSDGVMLQSTWTPDGYYVDENGAWVENYTGAASTDADTVYNEMIAKTQNLSDINAYYDLTLRMTDGTENLDMRIEMNARMSNLTNPDLMRYLVYARMSMEGEQMTVSMYYQDGYCYADMAGQKFKYKMDIADAMKTAMSSAQGLDSGREFFTTLSLRTEGNTRILSYTMDTDKVNEYLQQMFRMMGMDALLNGITVTVRSAGGEYYINQEGYYTSARIDMTMDMTMEGETISVIVGGNMGIENPGQPVEIAVPDPASYREIVR